MELKKLRDIVEGIGHGWYFDDLQILQDAIAYDGEIPESYFYLDSKPHCYRTWGCEWRSKAEMQEIRQSLVDLIIDHINKQDRLKLSKRMPADHYARYLHALTIFRVPKTALQATSNQFRNAALALWAMDTGDKRTWEKLDSLAWNLSESMKALQKGCIQPFNF